MTPSRSTSTLACFVTFEPNLSRLEKTVGAAITQAPVLLIDNASSEQTLIAALAGAAGADIILNEENIGLGAAYNIAVEEARRLEATGLLLLDQDTLLPPGYLQVLEVALSEPGADDIVAVGGSPVDHRVAQKEYHRTEIMQASGTLLRVAAFDLVGLFESALFIHHVDKEWFYRARHQALRTKQLPDLPYDHEAGASVSTLRFLPKAIRWQSDSRLFFGIRNTLWLTRRAYLPACWRGWQLIKISILVTLHLVVRPGRRSRLSMVFRALRAGARPPRTRPARVPKLGGI